MYLTFHFSSINNLLQNEQKKDNNLDTILSTM